MPRFDYARAFATALGSHISPQISRGVSGASGPDHNWGPKTPVSGAGWPLVCAGYARDCPGPKKSGVLGHALLPPDSAHPLSRWPVLKNWNVGIIL